MTRALPVKLMAFFLGLTLLAGCQPSVMPTMTTQVTPSPSVTPVPTTIFTLPRSAEEIHPILSKSAIDSAIVPLVWEGLFTLDNTFTPQFTLCQAYEHSVDYRTWTFSLRAGATFSNGQPLTATDVVHSLNLARSGGQYAPRLAQLTNVSAIDNATVSITLAQANSALPALLDVPILSATTGLGTGAYVLDGDRLVAAGTQPNGMPTTIALHTVTAPDQLFPIFLDGDLSLLATQVDSAPANTTLTFWSAPTTTMLYLGFHCQSGLCANKNLRQVIQNLLPREEISNVIYKRCSTATPLPISPYSPLYDEDLAQSLTLTSQAQLDAMAAAGYVQRSDGKWLSGAIPLTLTLLVNSDNGNRVSAAQAIATQLADFGIDISITALPWTDYLAALKAGSFDLYLAETTLTADFNLSPILSGSLNFGKYTSTTTPGLLSAFQASDQTQRFDAGRALMTTVANDVPIAPIAFQSLAVFTQNDFIHHLAPTRQNPLAELTLVAD